MMQKISVILGGISVFLGSVCLFGRPVQAQVPTEAVNEALAESAGDVTELVRSLAESEAGYESPRSLEKALDEEGTPVSLTYCETVYDAEGRRLFYGRRYIDLTPSEEEAGSGLVRTYTWEEDEALPVIREVSLTLEEGKNLSAAQIEELPEPEEEEPYIPEFDEEGRITAVEKDSLRLEISYDKQGRLQRIIGLEDGTEVYRAAFAATDSGVPEQCQTEEHGEDGEIRYTLWMFSFDEDGRLIRAEAFDEDRAWDEPMRTIDWEVRDAEEEALPTGYVQCARYRNGKLAGIEVSQVEEGRIVSKKLFAADGSAIAAAPAAPASEESGEAVTEELSCGDVMERSSFTDENLTFTRVRIKREPFVWFAGSSVMEINGAGSLLWYVPSDFGHFGSVLLDTPYGKALFRDLGASVSPENSDGKYFVLRTGENAIACVPYAKGFQETEGGVTVTVFGTEELLDVSEVPQEFRLEEGAAQEILEEAKKAYEDRLAGLLQEPFDWPPEEEAAQMEEPEETEGREDEAAPEAKSEETPGGTPEKTVEEASGDTTEQKLAEAKEEGVAIASVSHYPDAEGAALAFLEALSGVEEERLSAYCAEEGIDDLGFSDMYEGALEKAPAENREEVESLIHRALRFDAAVTGSQEAGDTTEVFVTLSTWDFDAVMDSAVSKTMSKALLRYGFKVGSAPKNELISIFVEAAGEALDQTGGKSKKTELKLVCEQRDGFWYVLNPDEVVDAVKGTLQPVLDTAADFGIGKGK